MSLHSFIDNLFGRYTDRPLRKNQRRVRPTLQTLEERIVPTIYSPGGDGVAGTLALTSPLTMSPADTLKIDLGGTRAARARAGTIR